MVWALHFLASYITAALDCAGHDAGALSYSYALIAAYTALALLLIALHAARSFMTYRESQRASAWGALSADDAERTRFLAWTGFLLAVLSTIATVFGALPLLLHASCR